MCLADGACRFGRTGVVEAAAGAAGGGSAAPQSSRAATACSEEFCASRVREEAHAADGTREISRSAPSSSRSARLCALPSIVLSAASARFATRGDTARSTHAAVSSAWCFRRSMRATGEATSEGRSHVSSPRRSKRLAHSSASALRTCRLSASRTAEKAAADCTRAENLSSTARRASGTRVASASHAPSIDGDRRGLGAEDSCILFYLKLCDACYKSRPVERLCYKSETNTRPARMSIDEREWANAALLARAVICAALCVCAFAAAAPRKRTCAPRRKGSSSGAL